MMDGSRPPLALQVPMPQPRRKPTPSSPFLSQRLAGWTPVHPNLQFPVTFGIYEEGENLALYLTPASLEALCATLDLPGEDQAVYLSGDPEAGPSRVVPWSAVQGPEGEVVHIAASAVLDPETIDALPVPLLAAVAEALPLELGSRAAVSVQDGCHGAVIARDRGLLRGALRCFLEEYVATAVGPAGEVPSLRASDLEPLLQPLTPESWYDVTFLTHKRYWTLEVILHGGRTAQRHRWVCEGERGRWRSGWS